MVPKNKDGGTQREVCVTYTFLRTAAPCAVAYVIDHAAPQLTFRDVEALETRPLLYFGKYDCTSAQ
jgi:hypothetical protein